MSNDVAEQPNDATEKLTDDLLWGTQAIADFIGKSLTQAQYLIRIGAVPVGKLGPKTIVGSKRKIRQHMNKKCAA